jgi:hypothetical protein
MYDMNLQEASEYIQKLIMVQWESNIT